MQQSKYRGCINTAAVVSIPLRRYLCIRFESILQERKPISLWLFSVRCRHIASDHRAVATWPSGGGSWKFREKKRKSQRKERKKQAFIYPIARHLPPHACAKRKSVFSENKCTASCSRAYGSAKQSGKYSGHFHKKFSGQDNILGVFRVFANSNNGKCAVRL